MVPPRGALTKAEDEVSRLVAKGMSNKPIAAARATKARTVANHPKAIFQEFGVQSRVELVMLREKEMFGPTGDEAERDRR